MIVLRFLGRDAESDALLFADEEGTQYAAPLSDSLSNAILRGVSVEVVGAPKQPLTPREIQALLREGLSAEQIAEQSATDLERIRRYEGPVNAEIQRAVSRVQNSRVGSEAGSPTLGDLVVDRLAQRNVDTDQVTWRAVRRSDGTWEVSAIYVEDNLERSASWTLSEPTNLAIAKDDNARALTEVTRAAEPVRALFPPVSTQSRQSDNIQTDAALERQEQLLNRLNAQRGRRQPVLLDFESEDQAPSTDGVDEGGADDPETALPAATASVSVPVPSDAERDARPTLSDTKRPQAAATRMGSRAPSGRAPAAASEGKEAEVETTVLPPGGPDISKRRRRTPVPSWDEIVFGSRPE